MELHVDTGENTATESSHPPLHTTVSKVGEPKPYGVPMAGLPLGFEEDV